MVVIKSLQFLPAVITAALKETTNNSHEGIADGSLEPNSHGNMFHIALVGVNNQMSLLQDRYMKASPLFVQCHLNQCFTCFMREPSIHFCLSYLWHSVGLKLKL